MNELLVKHNEIDLYIYLQKVRLQAAKDINDSNIENTKNVKEEKITLKGFLNNIGNSAKRTFNNYDKKNSSILNELSRFDEENQNVIDEDTAYDLADSLFKDDKYGLSKLVFAVTVILDDNYHYEYNDEGLEEASDVLYGGRYFLRTIKRQLENNYNAISPTNLSNLQKGLLLGVAITALAGVVTMPVLLGAGAHASAAATTAALAMHGFGDMQIGLGIITLESLLVGATLTGIAYGGMKLYNDAKVKQEFASLSPEKNALYLAIQCTYIERIKDSLPEDEFKEQLDSILKNLNILKSDLDYYLFVENESNKTNKAKIKSFHEFDNRLMKVLDL